MDPVYCFPAQPDVIRYAAEIACKVVTRNQRTLIVCGSYTIGKERIFVAVAQALNCTVGVTKEKMSILQCLEDENVMSVVTEDWQTSQVHVLPMESLSHAKLKLHLDKFSSYFSSLVAFKPTGWTYNSKTAGLHSIKPSVKGDISVYGIPYSEHSSFDELRYFVQFLRPGRIVPTVGVGYMYSTAWSGLLLWTTSLLSETWKRKRKR
jgi:DNA cross-link repair 1A protein